MGTEDSITGATAARTETDKERADRLERALRAIGDMDGDSVDDGKDGFGYGRIRFVLDEDKVKDMARRALRGEDVAAA